MCSVHRFEKINCIRKCLRDGKKIICVSTQLIEAGVDIIIGHHPHVVQGMEVYQGKPIFYSLGNFVFDQYFSTATQEGLALAIDYTPSNFKINLLPFKSSLSKPKFMTEEDKAEFLQRFLSWSELEPDFVESVKAGRIELEFNK